MPKKVSFATSNYDSDPYNSSGFNGFPFAVNSRDEDGNKFQAWDGANHFFDGKARTVYGPGTFYPVGLTLEEVFFLYWRVKRLQASLGQTAPHTFVRGVLSPDGSEITAEYSTEDASMNAELTTGISGSSGDVCDTSESQPSADSLSEDDEVKSLIQRPSLSYNNDYQLPMSAGVYTGNKSYVYFMPPASVSDENIQASVSYTHANVSSEPYNNADACANEGGGVAIGFFTSASANLFVFRSRMSYVYAGDPLMFQIDDWNGTRNIYADIKIYPMIYSEDTELYYPSIELSASMDIGDPGQRPVMARFPHSISTCKFSIGQPPIIDLYCPSEQSPTPPSNIYSYTSSTCSLILPNRTITFPIYGINGTGNCDEINVSAGYILGGIVGIVSTPTPCSIWVSSYWPYDDGNGNPIYDINSGATLRDPVTGAPV